jgi:hypothetical protein
MAATGSAHRWRFFRAGGFDQVKLASGLDLASLRSLDQKLWVALASPTKGLDLDARTAALIDTDKDGRIRAPELLEAVDMACRNLKRPDDLLAGASELPLAAINDETPEGKTLLAAARRVLANLGKPEATAVTVAEFAEPQRLFAGTRFNGDGVVVAASAGDDEELKAIIVEIGAAFGTEADRSGELGVGPEKIDAFFAAVREHDAWYKEGEADPAVLFLGPERTAAAAAAVEVVQAKVDDYFTRCRIAAFDARTATLLNRQQEEYQEVLSRDVTADASELAGFPLAQAAAGRPLPLGEGLNPAHADAVAVLRRDAVGPVLGESATLTEQGWQRLKERLAPYFAWSAARRGAAVAPLGIARVRALVGGDAQKRMTELVAQDRALEPEATAIDNVERLVRYHRDLFRLCTNFVSFEDFYDGGEPAIFQIGTLYLDQRACKLCLPVDDPARHAVMAGLAGAYLAYLDCVRPSTSEKMQIVAAFTAGDSDNLMIGRNGVFYDRRGLDWDATITKIIDNPISVRQAFFAPYKKFLRMLEEQVAKRATAAEGEAHKQLGDVASTTANLDKSKPPPAAPAPKKLDVGTVAALGVAFGAIGSFVTAIIGYATGVLSLGVPATVGAILALMLVISTPSVILAYLKLRKRNLGPILDANGWAINTRARINVPFGATLTAVAKLPRGARRDAGDRYAERTFPWKTVLVVLAVIYLAGSWYQGRFDRHLPEPVRSTSVLGSWAPRSTPVANPANDLTRAVPVVPVTPPPPATPAPAPK